MRWRLGLAACVLPLALLAQGAAAQSANVSAGDPQGMVTLLASAGYQPTLESDSYGDPLIKIAFGGYGGQIVFYGCNETSHDGCNSVQFVVGLDREQPMQLAALNQIVAAERFISMSLDEEGDPWITWDIVTMGGIPRGVFLQALAEYSAQVENVAGQVFGEAKPTK